ncbi:hypothetical protein [Flavobacterium branchiicola]|uniref:Uncharacterized protein n=1 Tax=Flavobacterium branchiicola TaxID=1114875 RepID=A0ABV9PCS8_9FLAO|nr:hypothetical protein [Flavobacterium branchiicola]MBS7254540.1 hypothetical protein [Flavobacterium branchiicola]
MKYTLLLLFVLLTSFRPPESNVFICGPSGAKKYHYNENCRGLSACRHEVVKTSLKQAQGYGLTLCGWED